MPTEFATHDCRKGEASATEHPPMPACSTVRTGRSGWNSHHVAAIQEIIDDLNTPDLIDQDRRAGIDCDAQAEAVLLLERAISALRRAERGYGRRG
ncbi:MAG: hypothetical protein A2286_02520 [Gammaproteobacteria bacterium RIFOXYA12_FULL_61_12]|nr:MAG: hypothetical protein A2514_10325 [Gammaproteobacteria bacterium RIFOXYD12_FULL_61_37]OGT92927.1 MAG: hypothetical protein A2286_02520 [Gammaproteobacteria bacterium RIFOXYA12_FULL_61_12]